MNNAQQDKTKPGAIPVQKLFAINEKPLEDIPETCPVPMITGLLLHSQQTSEAPASSFKSSEVDCAIDPQDILNLDIKKKTKVSMILRVAKQSILKKQTPIQDKMGSIELSSDTAK